MILMGNVKNLEKNLSWCHFSITYPTYAALGMNLGLHEQLCTENDSVLGYSAL
jgi:hypothetical protein